MNKRLIIYIFICILFGLLFYFLTYNIIFTIITFIIYLAFSFYCEFRYKIFVKELNRSKECINLINNFIITLSVNNSIETTYLSLKESFSNELNRQVQSINNLNSEEQIHYLDNYFKLPIYSLFLKLLDEYLFNGGNLLDNSNLLIFDSRRLENNIDEFLSSSKRKLIEFIMMWGLCFLILVLMKIFLKDYYTKIRLMTYFPISIFIFFIVFLFSFFLFINHSLNIKFIKGE